MIRFLVILFWSLILCSCQNTVKTSENIEMDNEHTALIFGSINEKIFDDIRTLFDGKYENFKLTDYYQHLNQYRSAKALALKEDLRGFETQTLYPYADTVVFCIHSKARKLAICDDPRCPGVEKIGSGEASLFNEWIGELPLGVCPVRPKINY